MPNQPIAIFLSSILLLAITLPGSANHGARTAQNSKPAKRVLVISLDGLDARYLEKRDEYKLKIPNLRKLMADGATARGVWSVYPSVTYPAHTTIVTGAYPAKHGILGNEIFEPPDRPRTGKWNWFAEDIKIDTLWSAATRANLKTAMVSWPVSAGTGDFNLPEIYQSGLSQEQTWLRISSNARPRELVAEVAQRGSIFSGVTKDETDDLRTRFAEYIIEEKRPDMVLVHLFDLDHFEHDFGPFTPEVFAILEKADGYVGRILAAAERAGTFKETVIFIVSDHGFMPVTQQVHPGVLLAKAGLITWRDKAAGEGNATLATDWRAAAYPTSGSCSIILRDPNDKETIKRVREIFKPLAGKGGSGIMRVLEAAEVRKLGGNPRATLMLEGGDGFTFGGNYTGEFITSYSRKGQHGFLPTRPNYKASLIVAGAGVARRGDLGDVRMIDIGPTIASFLNLKLKDAEGRALGIK